MACYKPLKASNSNGFEKNKRDGRIPNNGLLKHNHRKEKRTVFIINWRIHYGIQCIELTNIDKKSGHPSVAGMKQIADQVGAAVK